VLCDREGNIVKDPFSEGPDDTRKHAIKRPEVLVTLIEPVSQKRTPVPTALIPAREYRDGPSDVSGMHRVTFTPPAAWGPPGLKGKTGSGGPALVEVTIDGVEVPGSPFPVDIVEKMDLDHLMDHKLYVDDEWDRNRPNMIWDPTMAYAWRDKLHLPYERAGLELRSAGKREMTPASAVRLTRTLPPLEYGHGDEVDSLDQDALRCRHDRILLRERYALLQYRIGDLPQSYWQGRPGTRAEVPWLDYDAKMRAAAAEEAGGANAKAWARRVALEKRFTFPTLAMQGEFRDRYVEIFSEKRNELTRDVLRGKKSISMEHMTLPVYTYNPSRGSTPKEYFSRENIAKARIYGRWGVNPLTRQIPISQPGRPSLVRFAPVTAENATALSEAEFRPLDDTRRD